jgi:YesN/AraC family two-component response regulator
MFENVRMWTQQNLKFTVTIGIGEPVRQLADIPMSFKGALEALKYKIALGENRLITSDQIARHDQAEVYSHLNAIRSIVQSFRLLEDWRSGYGELFVHMKQGLLTKDEITNLMNYLIYSLGREMAAMNRDIQELWEREVLPKLSECLEVYQTLDQIREETERVLDSLSEYMAEAQAHRQYAVRIRDMRKYIEQHFMSPNISLDHLSDQFNISAKYISKLFKEETGQKFVDFLIDIRIKQAEKMLAETQTPVQEVAENVGYTSAISFSRVFKKVVGLSPSEYREEAARKQTW